MSTACSRQAAADMAADMALAEEAKAKARAAELREDRHDEERRWMVLKY